MAFFAGVDVGHSAVKVVVGTPGGDVYRGIFPSFVCPSVLIYDEAESARASRETVVIDGRSFFVGDTARIQGGITIGTGLLDEWVMTDQHRALVKHACNLVKRVTGDEEVHVVSGLPVSLFRNQKMALRNQFYDALGQGAHITVIPQPMAGYYHAILMRNGFLDRGRNIHQDAYAIIDIGYYTTDFVMVQEGRWVQSGASSAPGVRMAVDALIDALRANGIDVDLVSAERALVTHQVKSVREPERQHLVDMAVNKAWQTMSDHIYDQFNRLAGARAKMLDGIFVIGGAADIVVDRLKNEFPTAEVPRDVDEVKNHPDLPGRDLRGPRFLVAEGYYRLAINNNIIG